MNNSLSQQNRSKAKSFPSCTALGCDPCLPAVSRGLVCRTHVRAAEFRDTAIADSDGGGSVYDGADGREI